MKMIHTYALLCTDDDELMQSHGLRQPAAGLAAWRTHMLPPAGVHSAEIDLSRISERMVVYMTTRNAYASEDEFTVDYGNSYTRSYATAKKLTDVTGAANAAEVTHGLTLRGAQLTYAILCGAKRVENRHFRMTPGWYALHTGAKTTAHELQHDLLAELAATSAMPDEASLPHSAIVGAIKISHALELEQCAGEPWAFGPIVNVISGVKELGRHVPHRGALSVWRIDDEEREEVRSQLTEATERVNDISHLLPPSQEPACDAAENYSSLLWNLLETMP